MGGISQDITQVERASSHGDRNDEEISCLGEARYMALDRYPVTDLANALCRMVGNYLIDTDRRRKNRRGREALDKYHCATGTVIADLVLGFRRKKSLLSYRMLSSRTFTTGPVSYRNFKSIIDALKSLGLIFIAAQGFYKREITSSSRATRYGINTLLLEIAADFEITPANIEKHFAREFSRDPLVLHSAKDRLDWRHTICRYRPFTGKNKVLFKPTPQTRKLESEAMVRAMLQLKQAYGIPVLTVHDSIIVREQDICAAAGVVSRSFESTCGVEPEFGNWKRPASGSI